MDLKGTDLPASEAELAALEQFGNPWQGAPQEEHDARLRRSYLLPGLHALNDAVGWITPGGLSALCAKLGVPPAEAYGVASFYSLLATCARPQVIVHACDDIACLARGAERVCSLLAEELGQEACGDPGSSIGWSRSPCLGMCDKAPAVLVVRSGADRFASAYGPCTTGQLKGAITSLRSGMAPKDVFSGTGSEASSFEAPQTRFVLARAGRIDPENIDDYRAHGGYEALRSAVSLGRDRVLEELQSAGLLGRGGAAYPTGAKWAAVAHATSWPHYVVANADESEPGTFKDRILLEEDPFGLLEAVTIAGWVVGAAKGYIYIRGEYPLAHQRMAAAVAQARARGLLGSDVAGHGFAFDVEIRRGGGAYICGEETALFNSIEGKRGEPRNKPPFPTTSGLFGKPTLINNVETLYNILAILAEGARGFSAIGTGDSSGTRVFCVSGSVRRPGAYEVPFGTKLSEVLDLAGGTDDGRAPKAVLLGGAAGTFLGPDELGQVLSFEKARESGVSLGSGAIVVFDQSVDLLVVLARISRFFRDESCGQCVPCRIGTMRQEELVARLIAARSAHRTSGATRQRSAGASQIPSSQPLGHAGAAPSGLAAEQVESEMELLADLGKVLRDASICGLGQAASSALETAAGKFDLVEVTPT